eukprot:ANDGO_01604.mRNA.1 hypothetical protein CAOG_01958
MSSTEEVAATQSKWNANSYHWEEKDYSTWSKDRLKELLGAVTVADSGATVCVKEVKSVTGDAIVNIRKGKKRVGYEMKIECKVKAVVADADGTPVLEEEGEALFPYVCEDVDDGKFEIEIKGFADQRLRAAASGPFKKALLDNVHVWVDELQNK